jgi:hypothetical protein
MFSITSTGFDKTANNVLKTAMLNNMATVAMEQSNIKAIKILGTHFKTYYSRYVTFTKAYP